MQVRKSAQLSNKIHPRIDQLLGTSIDKTSPSINSEFSTKTEKYQEGESTMRALTFLPLLLNFSLHVMANNSNPLVPEKLESVEIISVDDLNSKLKEEYSKPMETRRTLLVDVRSHFEFIDEHITGAVSIPYKEKSQKSITFDAEIDQFALEEIAKRPEPEVVFYCNGTDCWKSYKAACWAVNHHLNKKIYWYRSGIPIWKGKQFATATGK